MYREAQLDQSEHVAGPARTTTANSDPLNWHCRDNAPEEQTLKPNPLKGSPRADERMDGARPGSGGSPCRMLYDVANCGVGRVHIGVRVGDVAATSINGGGRACGFEGFTQ